MEQDHYGTDDAKYHVQPEPEAHRYQASESGGFFANRIEYQQQHKAAADNTENITRAGFGGEVIVVTAAPSDQ